MEDGKKEVQISLVNGFSPVSSTPVFWKSRKRSDKAMKRFEPRLYLCRASMKNLYKNVTDEADKTSEKKEENSSDEKMEETTPPTVLSEKRKALFEPLEPIMDLNGRRPSAESLLPPPDFDSASYPRGWLIGKKRKLVNVDVVESMRRIADREIDGLNEQLDEDSRVLEHLQLQLLNERSKRADVERQNAMLQGQVDMLMNMLHEPENMDDQEGPQDP
ncbi:hypothetical protein Ccrd_015565 [Cynara cardunculus var. scolymus]|uniref:Protein HEADING DATE REPRESSOR 1 n=1 Tax=Cynara cardunculus var. scolymus TaxID=59895 RepID=A0A124SGE2_CYNCS|nr:hypothetical protein Ccrd_015565 [Cynara cardunculus var. scolymus]